jgi:hypothetical protein
MFMPFEWSTCEDKLALTLGRMGVPNRILRITKGGDQKYDISDISNNDFVTLEQF